MLLLLQYYSCLISMSLWHGSPWPGQHDPSMATAGASAKAGQRLLWPELPSGNPGRAANPGVPENCRPPPSGEMQSHSVQDDTLMPALWTSEPGELCLVQIALLVLIQVPTPSS